MVSPFTRRKPDGVDWPPQFWNVLSHLSCLMYESGVGIVGTFGFHVEGTVIRVTSAEQLAAIDRYATEASYSFGDFVQTRLALADKRSLSEPVLTVREIRELDAYTLATYGTYKKAYAVYLRQFENADMMYGVSPNRFYAYMGHLCGLLTD